MPKVALKRQGLLPDQSPKRQSKTISDPSRNRLLEDRHQKLVQRCEVQSLSSFDSLQRTDLVLSQGHKGEWQWVLDWFAPRRDGMSETSIRAEMGRGMEERRRTGEITIEEA